MPVDLTLKIPQEGLFDSNAQLLNLGKIEELRINKLLWLAPAKPSPKAPPRGSATHLQHLSKATVCRGC